MIDEGLFLPLYFHKRKKNNYGAQLVVPKSRAVVGRFALLLEKSSFRKALLSKKQKKHNQKPEIITQQPFLFRTKQLSMILQGNLFDIARQKR